MSESCGIDVFFGVLWTDIEMSKTVRRKLTYIDSPGRQGSLDDMDQGTSYAVEPVLNECAPLTPLHNSLTPVYIRPGWH